jgi:hypothetical protein
MCDTGGICDREELQMREVTGHLSKQSVIDLGTTLDTL